MPELTTIPTNITKDANPPLPNSTPVKLNVKKAPINATGTTDKITHAKRKDSKWMLQMKNTTTTTSSKNQ